MTDDTAGRYKNPPVIEMFSGVVFEPIDALKLPYYGLFWNQFRADYPICRHAPPIGLPAAIGEDAGGFPLPRIWFLNKTENSLIQLQTDRIILNWRKLRDDDKYPKYGALIGEFRTKLELFVKFLEEHQLGRLKPVSCELSYINHIPKGQGWEKLTDLSNVLTHFCWNSSNERPLPEPRDLRIQLAFAIPENRGSLTFSVAQQTRVPDKMPIIVLQLTANGLGPEFSSDAIWKWFDNAHNMINTAFEDLTTQSVRELWK
jgi:uncharacterized protein (TIGR04255 family)